jgi:hypothetical protein
MTRRAALGPGVRRALRLGAVEKADGAAVTTVHVAGGVVERGSFDVGRSYVQRCARCGRILATATDVELFSLAHTAPDDGGVLAARFFTEGRLIAEGPTANYLVSDRPLAADEQECELVPAFSWED